MKRVYSAIVMLAICWPVSAQEGGKYVWNFFSETQSVLTRDGKIVGQWFYPDGKYYPWDGVKNGAAEKPPIDPPAHGSKVGNELEGWQSNGVISRPDRDHTSYSGKAIHPSRIAEAFAGTLEDDSGKGYFLIISKDRVKREKVLADWNKLPVSFTSRYHVWMAPSDHFEMKDRWTGQPRFFTEGDPTIELMQRDGTVLFRRPQSEQRYNATDMQELLKSDPDYDPTLDPGAPDVLSSITLSIKAIVTLLLASAGALLIFIRRKV